MRYILFILFLSVLVACNSGKEKPVESTPIIETENPTEAVKESTTESNVGRSSWQKPELVIDKLGDIEGKTIADIGAGTGYFAYRMAFSGAKVLAIDVDQDMIGLMQDFKANLPKEVSSRIEPRKVGPNDPLLKKGEVDHAIIINTIAYINSKVAYLKKVRAGLQPEGKLMIVDYKYRDLDIPAPPLSERVAIGTLQEALRKAGFKSIELDEDSLDHQFIILAS